MNLYVILGIYLMLAIIALFRLDQEEYEHFPLNVFVAFMLLAPWVMLSTAIGELLKYKEEQW